MMLASMLKIYFIFDEITIEVDQTLAMLIDH